jgi:hypothetical protein
MELFAVNVIEQLGQDVLTGVHDSRITATAHLGSRSSSNRSHPLRS